MEGVGHFDEFVDIDSRSRTCSKICRKGGHNHNRDDEAKALPYQGLFQGFERRLSLLVKHDQAHFLRAKHTRSFQSRFVLFSRCNLTHSVAYCREKRSLYTSTCVVGCP